MHEFRSDLVIGQEEVTSEYMMRFVVTALRWLQPTATTDTWFVQGFMNPVGPIKVPTFSGRAGAAITAPQFSSDLSIYFWKISRPAVAWRTRNCSAELLRSFLNSNASSRI